MKKITWLWIGILTLGIAACGNEKTGTEEKSKEVKTLSEEEEGKECIYSFDPEKTVVSWVGYKHNTKVPVAGSFTEVIYEGEFHEGSVGTLIEGLEGHAVVSSLVSGDTTRDRKLKQFFFGVMANSDTLHANVINFEPDMKGDNAEGKCDLRITMNDITWQGKATYTIKGLKLEIESAITVESFNMETAYQEIHKACALKHTLADEGEPVTHRTFLVRLATTLNKKCSE